MPEQASVGPVVRPFARSEIHVLSCPIQASLGVLGRKWALTLLRDIAFYENMRFSDMLRNGAGITSRILSMRLSDLTKAGFIERIPTPEGGRSARYLLTAKGRDVIPILAAFVNFGIRHHADVVFADGKPRTLQDLLPASQCEMLGSLMGYADAAKLGGAGRTKQAVTSTPRAASNFRENAHAVAPTAPREKVQIPFVAGGGIPASSS